MTISIDEFRVRPGVPVDLHTWPTVVEPVYRSREDYHAVLHRHVERLSGLQERLAAARRHAVLMVLQGMDASGKDGTVAHVLSGINPQDCEVFEFKQPSAEESRHDFLWRTWRRLPERGRLGIFNRSYYEEVLVVRVHPEILADQGIDPREADHQRFWEGRYQSILDSEAHLHRNNTQIVKIFLHVSQDEQKRRFLARIDEPEKNWKFSLSDATERRFWNDYMAAYGACLPATSADHAPWYVVPADDKENARLIVSEILVETIAALAPAYPETTAERRGELAAIRVELDEKQPTGAT